MNNQAKLLLGGALALILGIAAALLFRDKPAEEAPKVSPSAPLKSLSARMENIDKAIPEEHDGTKEFLDDRWGHLGLEPEMAVKADSRGERYFIDRRVHVGVGRGGEKVYARAIHRAVYAPDIPRARFGQPGSTPGPSATIKAQPGGGALARLRAMDLAPITDPDKMPEGLKDSHPLAKPDPKVK